MKEVVAGIDIGGTNTKLGLVTNSGEVIAKSSFKTRDYNKIDDFVVAVTDSVNQLLNTDTDIKLLSIGIGAPNANFHKGTIEHAPNLEWKGIVPVVDFIGKKINVPVVITNDANAAALGEMVFGGAKKMQDFIVLTLGTGIGSGIVVNGEIVHGYTGFAGEMGHMILVPGGRDCGCGRQGCYETYASASGLVRTALYLLSEMREDSSLRDILPGELTAKKIAEEAVNNDPIAIEAIDYTSEMLALGIVNAIEFSSPEAIFLLGGLTKAGELLFKPVRNYVEENLQQSFKGTVKILPSGIVEENAAVLGAVALAWKGLDWKGL